MTADVDDLARGIFRTLDLPPAGLRFAAGLGPATVVPFAGSRRRSAIGRPTSNAANQIRRRWRTLTDDLHDQ